MAQLMPLPLTVSCFSKIQIGFTFLVPAHLGSPGKRAVKRVCICLSVANVILDIPMLSWNRKHKITTDNSGCYFSQYSQVTHTHTHPLNGPFSETTRVSRYQKGKTNLDFTEARDSEWQCHQLGRMQVCTALQTDNHASTPPLKFFTGRMPFLPPNQQCQSTEGKIQPSETWCNFVKIDLCILVSIQPSETRINKSIITKLHRIVLTEKKQLYTSIGSQRIKRLKE